MTRASSGGAPGDQPRGAQMVGASGSRTVRARTHYRRFAEERIAEQRRRQLAARRLPPLANGIVDPTFPMGHRRVQAKPSRYCPHGPDAAVGLGIDAVKALGREGRSCPRCPPGMWQVPLGHGWSDQ